MNKEIIEKRITDLKAQQKQLTDSFAVCEGAIQDCQFWLSELDKPKDKKDKSVG